MRRARSVALAMIGLALLWSAPAVSAPPDGEADGWYEWQVDGGKTTLYVRKQNGQPTQIRGFDSNCNLSVPEATTDMGPLSLDQSVAMLMDIVRDRKYRMEVREEALFWLARSNSDTAFEYFDQLLSDN